MDLHLDAVGGLSTKSDSLWKDLGGSKISLVGPRLFYGLPILVYGTFVYFGLFDLSYSDVALVLRPALNLGQWYCSWRYRRLTGGHALRFSCFTSSYLRSAPALQVEAPLTILC